MNFAEQQVIVDKVLRRIYKYIDSDAIVAGGAPRNWLFNKEANDIDLYLRSNVKNKFKLLEAILSNDVGVFEKDTKSSFEHLQNYGGLNVPITSLQGIRVDGVLFQFIFIDPSVKNFRNTVLNHMDIGINRIGYDSWEYIYTEEYRKDVSNKTLTLYSSCMCANQLKHCMTNHLPKMIKYFPEYKLLVE